MASEWEKGVVVGKTLNGQTSFVASSHDMLVLHDRDHETYSLGDCIEFKARVYASQPNGKTICERICVVSRRCDKFCEFEIDEYSNNCLLVVNITDVNECEDAHGRKTQVLRTDFLEKVYDDNFRHRPSTSRSDMLKMKVVCKRLTRNGAHEWILLRLKLSNRGNDERNTARRVDNEKPYKNTHQSYSITMKGFVCKIGPRYGVFYVLIPKNGEVISIADRFLIKPMTKERLHGRWISFTVDQNRMVDKRSSFEVINDVFPTRERHNCFEIKVPCYFEKCNFRSKMKSDVCGTIYDSSNTLKNYNRIGDEAWVVGDSCGENVVFELSDLQNEWGRLDHDVEYMNKRRQDSELPMKETNRQDVSGRYSKPDKRNTLLDEKRNSENRKFEEEKYYSDGKKSRYPTDERMESNFSRENYQSTSARQHENRGVEENGFTNSTRLDYDVDDINKRRRILDEATMFQNTSGRYSKPDVRNPILDERRSESRKNLESSEGKKSYSNGEKSEYLVDDRMKSNFSRENYQSSSVRKHDNRGAEENSFDNSTRPDLKTRRENNGSEESLESRMARLKFSIESEKAKRKDLEDQKNRPPLVAADELMKYKKIAHLFREMVVDEGVYRAMRDIDPKGTTELHEFFRKM